jgi:hypothetical protein
MTILKVINSETFKSMLMGILAAGVGILVLHFALVTIIISFFTSTLELFTGDVWWLKYGFFFYLALWGFGSHYAKVHWKSMFVEKYRVQWLCFVLLAISLSTLGQWMSRETRLEDQYICRDNQRIGKYFHSKPKGKYRASMDCDQVKNGFFEEALEMVDPSYKAKRMAKYSTDRVVHDPDRENHAVLTCGLDDSPSAAEISEKPLTEDEIKKMIEGPLIKVSVKNFCLIRRIPGLPYTNKKKYGNFFTKTCFV